MRKIIVLTFVSMDGVMQAPGGSDEDKAEGFKFGGWTHPYFDEFMGGVMTEQMGHDFDLLLGRKTYDLFASFWPQSKDPGAEPLNKAAKYVVTHSDQKFTWENSHAIKDVEDIKKLKETDGPELQVHGSSNLIQTLLKNNLVDELWLKIFPVTLGEGKRLFGEGTVPATFNLKEVKGSPKGVIIANYEFVGNDIKTGTFA